MSIGIHLKLSSCITVLHIQWKETSPIIAGWRKREHTSPPFSFLSSSPSASWAVFYEISRRVVLIIVLRVDFLLKHDSTLVEVAPPLGTWYFFTIPLLLSDTFVWIVNKHCYWYKNSFSVGFESHEIWVTAVMLWETQVQIKRYLVETKSIDLGLQLTMFNLCGSFQCLSESVYIRKK